MRFLKAYSYEEDQAIEIMMDSLVLIPTLLSGIC